MRVHVAPETFRRLVVAGEEHRLAVNLQGSLAVAAAVRLWRAGVASPVPAPADVPGEALTATLAGGAVVEVAMRPRVAADVNAIAAAWRTGPDVVLALILWASVRHYEPEELAPAAPPAPFVPRRWRVRPDVDEAIAADRAVARAAGALVFGDPPRQEARSEPGERPGREGPGSSRSTPS